MKTHFACPKKNFRKGNEYTDTGRRMSAREKGGGGRRVNVHWM